jgi:ketose-bisphosphate aldolase
MSIESVTLMMERAVAGGYAVGYFESWNLESLQGVIDASEQTRSPIMVGFNGDFLSHHCSTDVKRLSWYGALGRAAAESVSVPCGLIFNECGRDEWTRLAVTSGFNLVMPIGHDDGYEGYLRRTTEIARYAHEHGVAVEAELGELPNGLEGDEGGSLTDPRLAAEFVERSGVDLLAISIGNVHKQIQGERGLDLELLAAIRQRVPVPLVLHGGSGIAADALEKAVSAGVAKVNYGTYMKTRCLAALRDALGHDWKDPHRLLGYGGREDLMVVVRHAVRDAVLERIGLLGCCGKA